jgi:hypothetical protein
MVSRETPMPMVSIFATKNTVQNRLLFLWRRVKWGWGCQAGHARDVPSVGQHLDPEWYVILLPAQQPLRLSLMADGWTCFKATHSSHSSAVRRISPALAQHSLLEFRNKLLEINSHTNKQKANAQHPSSFIFCLLPQIYTDIYLI